MISPRIITSREIKLVGLKRTISLTQNQTRELWQSFIPQWKAADLPKAEFYSVEVYPKGYFASFDPNKEFEKWAAVLDMAEFNVPETWDALEVPAGLYAVFTYKGQSSEIHKMYQYIIGAWIPNSAYQLDNRPHMGVMGEKYKNDDPESEEELWIPVKSMSG